MSVDGVTTPDVDAVTDQIRTHRPKEKIDFVVLRDEVRDLGAGDDRWSPAPQPGTAVVGITLGQGYSYAPEITFDLGQQIGGPSAGMVFALGIYDKVTAGDLLSGRVVAGTGTINPDGEIGAIGGIRQKLASAERAGASVFLVPSANCVELAGVRTDLVVVKVATLSQAISQLGVLEMPGGEEQITRCEG